MRFTYNIGVETGDESLKTLMEYWLSSRLGLYKRKMVYNQNRMNTYSPLIDF